MDIGAGAKFGLIPAQLLVHPYPAHAQKYYEFALNTRVGVE